MSFFRAKHKKPLLIIMDVLLLNFAFVLSFYQRFGSDWLHYFNYRFFLYITVIGLACLFFSHLYNKMWKYASISELYSIFKATFMLNLFVFSYLFFSNITLPYSIVVSNIAFNILFLGSIRFFMRLFNELKNKIQGKRKNNNILIVGAGDAGEMLIREMRKHPELDKDIIGLIDDDPDKQNLEVHGKKVLGNRYSIPKIIRKHSIQEIIIAMPSASGKDIEEIYNLSQQNDIKVKIFPGVYEIIDDGFNLNHIREVKVEDLLKRKPVELDNDNISAYLKAKNILITGGAGSIGSEICRQVARFNPDNLVILDINENSSYFLELELKETFKEVNIITEIGNIQDLDKLVYLFAKYKPDVVFHAAAHKHVPLMEKNPEEAVKNNIFGTLNVARAADLFSVDKFVLISSDKAVNPTNIMGATKRVAEMIIQYYNKISETDYKAVRFGNVLDSNGSVIPIFKKQIAQKKPLTVTHQDVTRYFMTIPEASQLVIQAGALGAGGEVFVLDMGEPVKIMDLAENLIRLSGLEPGKDIEIKITGLRPGEKLYEELLNDDENIATEHEKIFINDLNGVDKKKLISTLDRLQVQIENVDIEGIIDSLCNLVNSYKPKRNNITDIKIDRKLYKKAKKKSGLFNSKANDEIAVTKIFNNKED